MKYFGFIILTRFVWNWNDLRNCIRYLRKHFSRDSSGLHEKCQCNLLKYLLFNSYFVWKIFLPPPWQIGHCEMHCGKEKVPFLIFVLCFFAVTLIWALERKQGTFKRESLRQSWTIFFYFLHKKAFMGNKNTLVTKFTLFSVLRSFL